MNKLSKLQLKTKAFAKEYIKNNFNGTETALKFGKKGMLRETAKTIASQNLSKLIYQKPIIEEMEKIKLDDTLINRITKRNIKQKGSLSSIRLSKSAPFRLTLTVSLLIGAYVPLTL